MKKTAWQTEAMNEQAVLMPVVSTVLAEHIEGKLQQLICDVLQAYVQAKLHAEIQRTCLDPQQLTQAVDRLAVLTSVVRAAGEAASL